MCMDTCTFSHFLSPQSWECQCPQVVKNRCCYIPYHLICIMGGVSNVIFTHAHIMIPSLKPEASWTTRPNFWPPQGESHQPCAQSWCPTTFQKLGLSSNICSFRWNGSFWERRANGFHIFHAQSPSSAAAEVPILIRSAKIDESCLQCWERFWGRTPGHCLYVCCPSCTERQCLQGPQFQDIALPARHRFAAWWGSLESSALSMWDWHVIDTSSSLRQAASLMHLEYTSNGTSAWALPRCFFMRTPAHPQRTTRRIHLLWGPLHQGPRAGHQCYGGSLCSLCSLVGSQVRSFRLREGKFEIGKHWCKQCKRMVCTAINIASVRIIWAPVGPCVHFSCIALVALSAQLTLGALS